MNIPYRTISIYALSVLLIVLISILSIYVDAQIYNQYYNPNQFGQNGHAPHQQQFPSQQFVPQQFVQQPRQFAVQHLAPGINGFTNSGHVHNSLTQTQPHIQSTQVGPNIQPQQATGNSFTTLASVITNNPTPPITIVSTQPIYDTRVSPQPNNMPQFIHPQNALLIHTFDPAILSSDPIMMESHPDAHTTVVNSISADIILTPFIVESTNIPLSPLNPNSSPQISAYTDLNKMVPVDNQDSMYSALINSGISTQHISQDNIIPVVSPEDNALYALKHDPNNIIATGVGSTIVTSNIVLVIHDNEDDKTNSTFVASSSTSNSSVALKKPSKPTVDMYTEIIIQDGGAIITPIESQNDKDGKNNETQELSDMIKTTHIDQLNLEKKIDTAIRNGQDVYEIDGILSTPSITSIIMRNATDIQLLANSTQIITEEQYAQLERDDLSRDKTQHRDDTHYPRRVGLDDTIRTDEPHHIASRTISTLSTEAQTHTHTTMRTPLLTTPPILSNPLTNTPIDTIISSKYKHSYVVNDNLTLFWNTHIIPSSCSSFSYAQHPFDKCHPISLASDSTIPLKPTPTSTNTFINTSNRTTNTPETQTKCIVPTGTIDFLIMSAPATYMSLGFPSEPQTMIGSDAVVGFFPDLDKIIKHIESGSRAFSYYAPSSDSSTTTAPTTARTLTVNTQAVNTSTSTPQTASQFTHDENSTKSPSIEPTELETLIASLFPTQKDIMDNLEIKYPQGTSHPSARGYVPDDTTHHDPLLLDTIQSISISADKQENEINLPISAQNGGPFITSTTSIGVQPLFNQRYYGETALFHIPSKRRGEIAKGMRLFNDYYIHNYTTFIDLVTLSSKNALNTEVNTSNVADIHNSAQNNAVSVESEKRLAYRMFTAFSRPLSTYQFNINTTNIVQLLPDGGCIVQQTKPTNSVSLAASPGNQPVSTVNKIDDQNNTGNINDLDNSIDYTIPLIWAFGDIKSIQITTSTLIAQNSSTNNNNPNDENVLTQNQDLLSSFLPLSQLTPKMTETKYHELTQDASKTVPWKYHSAARGAFDITVAGNSSQLPPRLRF